MRGSDCSPAVAAQCAKQSFNSSNFNDSIRSYPNCKLFTLSTTSGENLRDLLMIDVKDPPRTVMTQLVLLFVRARVANPVPEFNYEWTVDLPSVEMPDTMTLYCTLSDTGNNHVKVCGFLKFK